MTKENIATDLHRETFGATKAADQRLDRIMMLFGFREHYHPVRLAVSVSLAMPEAKVKLDQEESAVPGRKIPAHTLFGDRLDLWLSLIVSSMEAAEPSTREIKEAVRHHWIRGSQLLEIEARNQGNDAARLAAFLAEKAGPVESLRSGGNSVGNSKPESGDFSVSVLFGEVGRNARTDKPVDIQVNRKGVSPHFAIMGQTRSGKTRTGVEVVRQLLNRTGAPVFFVDPNGDWARDGELVAKPELNGGTLATIFPGVAPLDPRSAPIPLDFSALPPGSSESDIQVEAQAFRDAIREALTQMGPKQADALRKVIEEELTASRGAPVSLTNIAEAYPETDSVGAKLNELTRPPLFDPLLKPVEFFAQSRVLTLASTPSNEAKRLAVILTLNALRILVRTWPPGDLDEAGNRRIRLVLLIDEAHLIIPLKSRSLSELIRTAASKGVVIVLLSQSPEDFDRGDDDLLANIGNIGVFASRAASLRNLAKVMGRKVNQEDFAKLKAGHAILSTRSADVPGEVEVIAWK